MRDQQLDTLNDDLAREIERALAVEPSPEFHARVRGRVAALTPVTGAMWRWQLAGAGGIAVLLVLWLAVGGRDTGPGHLTGMEPQLAPPAAVASAPKVDETIRADHNRRESERQQGSRRVSRSASAATRPGLPEIVVSPEETAAFDRLLTAVRSPNVVFVRGDELLLDPVQPQQPDPLRIAAIEVAPVEISRKQEGEE